MLEGDRAGSSWLHHINVDCDVTVVDHVFDYTLYPLFWRVVHISPVLNQTIDAITEVVAVVEVGCDHVVDVFIRCATELLVTIFKALHPVFEKGKVVCNLCAVFFKRRESALHCFQHLLRHLLYKHFHQLRYDLIRFH